MKRKLKRFPWEKDHCNDCGKDITGAKDASDIIGSNNAKMCAPCSDDSGTWTFETIAPAGVKWTERRSK